MIGEKKRNDLLIIAVVFAIALIIRLVNLGSLPLTDSESVLALKALSIARRAPTEVEDQSAYIGLTAVIFYLTQAGVFLARFWPALVGSLIVFVPYVWREKLGRPQFILMAGALALDPLLFAGSRQAMSPMFALVGLVLGISLLLKGKRIFAGALLAAGILGGEYFWLGMLILILAFGIGKIYKLEVLMDFADVKGSWLKFLLSFAVSFLIISTSFGLFPAGLGGIMTGFIAFFARFSGSSDISIWQPLFALLAYAFLPLTMAAVGGVKAWIGSDPIKRLLTLWAICGVVVISLLPGRQIIDLVWVTLPLWMLSVDLLLAIFSSFTERKVLVIALGFFCFIIIGYITNNVRSLAAPDLITSNITGYLIAVGAGVLLLLISLLLVGMGWQINYAWKGLLLGSACFLLMLMLANTFRQMGVADERNVDLWQSGRNVPLSDLSVQIMQDLADQALGEQTSASVAVINMTEANFAWILRDFASVNFYNQLPADLQPEFVLTKMEETPQLSTQYRGQDLTWLRWVDWRSMTFIEHLRWLVNRSAPIQQSPIILWVRSDMFLDSAGN